jgi:hypothetical protein
MEKRPTQPQKPLTPKEMTPEQRQWKIKTVEEHIGQLQEALWYAKQDAARFVLSLDIRNAEKRIEAERAAEASEKEIEELKRQLSDLRAV